jgi:hypothetical protein
VASRTFVGIHIPFLTTSHPIKPRSDTAVRNSNLLYCTSITRTNLLMQSGERITVYWMRWHVNIICEQNSDMCACLEGVISPWQHDCSYDPGIAWSWVKTALKGFTFMWGFHRHQPPKALISRLREILCSVTEHLNGLESRPALSNAAPVIYFSGALRKHIIWADY